jgi:hypothetical protein
MDLSGNFTGQEQQEHVVAKKLGKQTTLNIDHKFRYIVVVFLMFFKRFFTFIYQESKPTPNPGLG